MARQLAQSTLDRLRRRLEDEETRLTSLLDEMEREREEAVASQTSSERSPDPNTAEGGSMAFEMEKELSIAQNAQDLLDKVRHALGRMDEGTYGICEVTGESIPVARLEALPCATTIVGVAEKR